MGDAGRARDAFGSCAKGSGDVGVGGGVPSPVGPLVFVDFAGGGVNGIVGIGSVVPLVALGDAAQCRDLRDCLMKLWASQLTGQN